MLIQQNNPTSCHQYSRLRKWAACCCRFFSLPWALFFGRISYSLYLLHVPVLLFTICRVTGQRLPWYQGLGVFAVVLAISIGAAELMWRWVEAPSIRAGRWLNERLGRKRSTPPI